MLKEVFAFLKADREARTPPLGGTTYLTEERNRGGGLGTVLCLLSSPVLTDARPSHLIFLCFERQAVFNVLKDFLQHL